MNEGLKNEQEALDLLKEDLNDKYIGKARKVFDEKFSKGSFDPLSLIKREMLIEFAFNLGEAGLKKFQNFMTGIKENDKEKVKKECIRWYTPKGKT